MMFIMSMTANQMAWITSDFKNIILMDITKMTFLYIISLLYIYSLVREYDHFDDTKRNLIVNENVTCSFS